MKKTCPECAEKVKAAARSCRYCGYRFEGEDAPTDSPPNRRRANAVASGCLVAVLCATVLVAFLGAGASSPRKQSVKPPGGTAAKSPRSGAAKPPDKPMMDPAKLADDYKQELQSKLDDAKLDPASEPDETKVDDVFCVHQQGRDFSCNIQYEHGDTGSVTITVSEDG